MAPITTNPNSSAEDLPSFKLPSETQLTDLQLISTLIHLLHHRNHNQHRRSTWYRHFNIFRRQLSSLLVSITSLQQIPDTNLARHRKKATDKKTELEIRQRFRFWRDVLVPKAQHAFGQLMADGRFAVLGVMLLACLGSVCRIVGLVGVYEELGQKEVERVLEEFAKEGWGEDEGLGVLVPRETGGTRAGDEDLGEVLGRGDGEDEGSVEDLEAAIKTENEVKARESACLAPERDTLRRSRDALREMSKKSPASASASASASPAPQDAPIKKRRKSVVKEKTSLPDDLAVKKTKRVKIEGALAVSKPAKKKRKKNAIDDLFSGL